MCNIVSRSLRQCARFLARNDGQISVIFALAAIPLVGAVGAAVDFSGGHRMRASLQAALDDAVLAAAIGGGSDWESVALYSFKGNAGIKGLDTSGVTPKFSKDGSVYYGQVSASVPTTFAKIIGFSTLPIGAKSAATTAYVPLCVLGLNAFDKGAFDMNGNSVFNAPGCAVQVNTSANRGMTQEGKPTAKAAKFNVSGGHTGDGYSSAPQDGAATVPDPYASIPFPDHDSCSGKNPKGMVVNGGAQTLWPGTYCGGLTIKGQASVTLQPGIYVMVEGALLLDGGASITGREVMVAFTGTDATLRVWGNSTLDLTSPKTGTYANFQFFQDVNDANGRGAWVSIGGNGNSGDLSKATWDGIAYFPTQNFWAYGNVVVNANSPSMAIVAGQIWDQGNATINVTNSNSRGLDVPQTQVAGGARLLQ